MRPVLGVLLAGALLSFVLSFDEFIIAFFVAGPNPTLPIFMLASVKRGITPELNAIETSVLGVSSLMALTVFLIARKSTWSRKQCLFPHWPNR